MVTQQGKRTPSSTPSVGGITPTTRTLTDTRLIYLITRRAPITTCLHVLPPSHMTTSSPECLLYLLSVNQLHLSGESSLVSVYYRSGIARVTSSVCSMLYAIQTTDVELSLLQDRLYGVRRESICPSARSLSQACPPLHVYGCFQTNGSF